jgi:hypothetical protein
MQHRPAARGRLALRVTSNVIEEARGEGLSFSVWPTANRGRAAYGHSHRATGSLHADVELDGHVIFKRPIAD